jgi:hypothetical protein
MIDSNIYYDMTILSIEKRVDAIVALGAKLRTLQGDELEELCYKARSYNGWFTVQSVEYAIASWGNSLNKLAIQDWISAYSIIEKEPKKVGLVTAGNIPLVGLHDVLSIILSGNIALVKLSSDDKILMQFVFDQLYEFEPALKDYILVVERLNEADAFIATGSNNSSRYFDYYFGKKPNIIRKNRTSVAVLTGKETREDFLKLGEDIFRYYGLGCRNVSKVFVPEGFDPIPMLHAFEDYKHLFENHKYANNYDYNRSIYLVKAIHHLDNGVVLYKDEEALVSPIAVLYWETYISEEDLAKKLNNLGGQIQCIVSLDGMWKKSLPFGKAQDPGLKDYADDVDTILFLLSL